MISWKRSFVIAIKILLVSIVWYFIGMIIAAIGIALTGVSAMSLIPGLSTGGAHTPSGLTGGATIATLGAGILFVIIGCIVAGLGAAATTVKFIIDEAVKIAEERLSSRAPPPAPGSYGAGYGCGYSQQPPPPPQF